MIAAFLECGSGNEAPHWQEVTWTTSIFPTITSVIWANNLIPLNYSFLAHEVDS